MSVLIIEDEPPIRAGLQALLERHYPSFGPVTACASAAEALAAFDAQEFDLVVTDIHLGETSGLEVLKAIHLRRPGTPTVVLSGHREFSWAQEAIRYGVRAYLLKPLDLAEFAAALEGIAPPLVPTLADEKAKQVLQYLLAHLEEDLDMARVANSVNLSYSYFSGWFRDVTGLNYSDFLLRLRIDRARRLLADPTALVAEVARQVGYPDARTFSKAYHRVTGRSPSEDRASPS